MFDIREYIGDYTKHQYSSGIYMETENIDEDISSDIDNLLKNRFSSLYLRDKFKYVSSGIEIIYPQISYQGRKAYIKNPDYVRFLLSLYPMKSDYENIDKIVLRPRHVEVGGIELMAIYIRSKRILINYLHTPHYYLLNNSKFSEYSEFLSCQMPELTNNMLIKKNPDNKKGSILRVPPLWYVLSIVSCSNDDKIDKFFIKKNNKYSDASSSILDEISFYYSRHGY